MSERNKGLPLNFDYKMMALIRELVTKERHNIWMEKYAPNMTKNATLDNYKEAYKILIEDCRTPWLKEGLCNLILDKINNMEEQIKAGLSGRVFHCPKCDKDVEVVEQEKPKDIRGFSLFFQLPKCSKLSCGHTVDIQGKIIKGKENKQ